MSGLQSSALLFWELFVFMLHVSFNTCHTNKHCVDYLGHISPCLSYVACTNVINRKYIVYLCGGY
jgi:hypothetical protein